MELLRSGMVGYSGEEAITEANTVRGGDGCFSIAGMGGIRMRDAAAVFEIGAAKGRSPR